MNNATIRAVTAELEKLLKNRPFGKIFQLSRRDFAIDFRLPESLYLFISITPGAPRLYLIKRRLRDLEKISGNPSPFVLFIRKRLSNAVVQKVAKDEGERIVRFSIAAADEIAGTKNYVLVAQLTGRSANLFLLDENDFILDALRENEGAGQTIATKFSPPARRAEKRSNEPALKVQSSKTADQAFPHGSRETLSEALDAFYLNLEAEKAFLAKAKSAAAKVNQEIARGEKLRQKLNADLENHGDAEHWKRLGDLILANLADAVRIDGKLLLVDYFDEATPAIEIETDENLSLTETAEKFFKRYTKARNAKEEIAKRLTGLETQIADLQGRKARIEQALAERDEDFFNEIAEKKTEKTSPRTKSKRAESFSGARRYISSDGLEILVGKGSKDNDQLTFRVAKSLDFWLHAADYAGSHVVVRNPNRMENLPPKTLLEAAELAAFFSQGKTQPKAAVNYTQKKFVNKPKGAAAGLVSLASFKTVLVEPRVGLERL